MFIDFTEVELASGKGGKGSVHFRREKYVPKGGPDGGDGGRGGHVIFQADVNLHTLQDVRYKRKYHADDGKPGAGSMKSGKNGQDVIVKVPVGTIVRRKDTGEVVVDFVDEYDSKIICKGGKGGRGNVHFKSATNQSPRKAEPGLPGEMGKFEIELKVLADVGLVGLPNSGKSTLLSRISAARPKIADYPFTTLEPKLGIVKYGEYQSFVMADIPGLIQGASEGKGLGHQFLKHVERNKVLLYLIDTMDETPMETYTILRKEVLDFNPDLIAKPFLICRTKADLKNEVSAEWADFETEPLVISSVTGEGLDPLISELVKLID